MKVDLKMHHKLLIGAFLFIGLILLITYLTSGPTIPEQVAGDIEVLLQDPANTDLVFSEAVDLHADSLLRQFYKNRLYMPAWIDNRGIMRTADSLIVSIRDSYNEGFHPEDYHYSVIDCSAIEIRALMFKKREVDIQKLMRLDMLMSDAFLLLANHMLSGRVNHESIDPEWLTKQPEVDLDSVLNVATTRKRIRSTLNSLRPQIGLYNRLRSEVLQYREIAKQGGWPIVPEGDKLVVGDNGYRVAALNARLIASGDLKARSREEMQIFDDELLTAVKGFQARNGLRADGVVGTGTIRALNRPTMDYVHKIEVNLERWRWLPRDLGDRYIMVNIADFTLNLYENGKSILTMPVVVGSDYRRTPVFSGLMTYLVLNPYWHLPSTIIREDVLPAVKRSPSYLTSRHIDVVRTWNDPNPIDPFSIDWSSITEENLPYRFRQAPGPHNALGRIKFMFPNKYDIYLHDTPSRSLFDNVRRAYSSGCIRVSEPVKLAEYVIGDSTNWSTRSIEEKLREVEDYTVRLKQSIPVHILYSTAWVAEDGTVQFRDDVYERDILVENALRAEMVLHD